LWIEPAACVRRRKDRARLFAEKPRALREETGFCGRENPITGNTSRFVPHAIM
jgi:hypothetical protein